MDKDTINKSENRHNWIHIWWLSAFGALLIFCVFFLSIYKSSDNLQGYLVKTTTLGTSQIDLYYEHMHVVDGPSDTVVFDFYVDNVTGKQIGIFALSFMNLPPYLEYASNEKGTILDEWQPMGPGLSTVFVDKTNTTVSYASTTNYLQDGHLFSVTFNLKAGQAVTPKLVQLGGIFSTLTNNYTINESNFLITSSSRYYLEHPNLIEPTSSISVPFKFKATGTGAISTIKGITIDLENIPSYLQIGLINTNNYVTSDWQRTQGWIQSSNYDTNKIYRIAMTSFSGQYITSNDTAIFDLNFSIAQSATVTIPDLPIIVNATFTPDPQTNYYAEPTMIYVGGEEITELLGDICSLDASGNIVNEPNGIVGIPDLSCFIQQWGDTGSNLSADLFKLDSQNIVNIRDLTILMSQWSQDPIITSINPQSGATGTVVTITGSNFYDELLDSNVKLFLKNGTTTFAMNITGRTDTVITTTVPSGVSPTGRYNIMLAIDDELYVTKDGFTVN